MMTQVAVMKSMNIDMQQRANRNKATMRKQLPKEWRTYIENLPQDCSIKDVAISFGYTAVVIHRWRHECAEFDKAVQAKLSPYSRAAINKNTEHSTRKINGKPPQMSPDEIDDLIMRLIEIDDDGLAKDTRAAIRQLRSEIRALKSELNRRAHSAHVRAAGRPLAAAGGATVQEIQAPEIDDDD